MIISTLTAGEYLVCPEKNNSGDLYDYYMQLGFIYIFQLFVVFIESCCIFTSEYVFLYILSIVAILYIVMA